MAAYYNEIDPFAAAWLRELIKAGHIAAGEVDERSIEDVVPSDLNGFKQCHFFAGIGVWSHALRRAGWPDDKPVWTGSCPCQPFSSAGKGAGVADERHLWPAWHHLITQCRPDVVFGEQVEAAIRHGWLDLVQSDLEGIRYSFRPVGLPSAGFGAPHARHRIFFVSDSSDFGHERFWETRRRRTGPENHGATINLADTQRNQEHEKQQRPAEDETERGSDGVSGRGVVGPSFWNRADWLYCRDNKYRPVEPGTFPLAHGAPNRVGRLRGYGNAIVAPVAQAFIESYIDATK